MVQEGDLLWKPDREWIANANITPFTQWVAERQGLEFPDYASLWQWSVDNIEAFWECIWIYFRLESSAPYECVLEARSMPGANWFPGARLNYAQHILRGEQDGGDALLAMSELRSLHAMSWQELGAQVRVLATQLRAMGITRGDRVAAYLPNIPEAVVALLAVTSIGAIWSSCSPDYGVRSVLDRFSQIEPRLIFCVDGYRYRGRDFDRRAELAEVISQLPSIEHVVYLPYLDTEREELPAGNAVLWRQLMDHPPVPAEGFAFEQVPFDHPLWILYSSGTTGLPKPIVHGHGGILLMQFNLIAFHMDIQAGDRMFFFTTTGWMMWNFLVSSLLLRAVPVLYDGNPAWPEPDVLWKIVDEAGIAFFGASPTYVQMLEQAGMVPKDRYALERLDSVILAGSPVSAEVMDWFYRNVKKDLWVAPGSGGTDVCAGYVGGMPTLPVYAGEIQARHLGVDARAFNPGGEAVINEVGELVICKPMPSMPVCFWNDPDNRRYRESYFEEFPGVWRQGDFFMVNDRGGCFVLGRSDATLNRFGVRIGTAEIYRCVESIPEVADTLIVNLDLPGGRFFMPLFVKMKEGVALDDEVQDRIRRKLRKDYSPRHVPDRMYQVDTIPYTLTGKKMEVPVRRILMGTPMEKVANPGAMQDPHALDYFVRFAAEQQPYPAS